MSSTAETDLGRVRPLPASAEFRKHVRRAWPDLIRAAWIGGGMTAAAGLVAAVVWLCAAAPIRRWLGLPFGGIQPELSQVLGVLANNLRLLGGLFAAAVVGQLAVRTSRPTAHSSGGGMRVMVRACDAILALASANHVFLVGATVGGYGRRGLSALLPHGPIELAAYSLGLSLYVAARRERLAKGRALTIGGLSVVLLTISAVVEVML